MRVPAQEGEQRLGPAGLRRDLARGGEHAERVAQVVGQPVRREPDAAGQGVVEGDAWPVATAMSQACTPASMAAAAAATRNGSGPSGVATSSASGDSPA